MVVVVLLGIHAMVVMVQISIGLSLHVAIILLNLHILIFMVWLRLPTVVMIVQLVLRVLSL